MEETTDNGFVEDAADVDARKMAMKAAEGLELDTYLRYSFFDLWALDLITNDWLRLSEHNLPYLFLVWFFRV